VTKPVIPFAAILLFAGSVYGQKPAGAGSGTSTADKYCAEHPAPSDKCIGPGVSIPPDQQSYAVPKKAVIIPRGSDLAMPKPSPGALRLYPLEPPPSFVTPAIIIAPLPEQTYFNTPPPPKPYVNSCDANCQQQNFNSGYAAGHAVGSVIGSAIERRRASSYCKKHPSGGWRFADGSSMDCEALNSGRPTRTYPPSAQLQGQLKANANRAHAIMEADARDLETVDDPALKKSMIEIVMPTWAAIRDMYCGYYHGAIYTDLEGNQQTCGGTPSQF
jgi:hypothetical protein